MDELIERLARECDVWPYPGARIGDSDGFKGGLRRFAALVAEECAKVCDELSNLGAWHDPVDAGHAANEIREKFKPLDAQRAYGDALCTALRQPTEAAVVDVLRKRWEVAKPPAK